MNTVLFAAGITIFCVLIILGIFLSAYFQKVAENISLKEKKEELFLENVEQQKKINKLEDDLIESRKNDHRDPKTGRFVSKKV